MTFRAFLQDDLGLRAAMRDVPEFGDKGEFWSSTPLPGRGGPDWSKRWTVSTNNAFSRGHDVNERFYALQTMAIDAWPPDVEKFQFLWSSAPSQS
jgi:hypothetical protein